MSINIRYTISWFLQLSQIRVWFHLSIGVLRAPSDLKHSGRYTLVYHFPPLTTLCSLPRFVICYLFKRRHLQSEFTTYGQRENVNPRKLQDKIENMDNYDLRCHLWRTDEVRSDIRKMLWRFVIIFPIHSICSLGSLITVRVHETILLRNYIDMVTSARSCRIILYTSP